MKVHIKKLYETAIIPKYQTNGSVGFDLSSNEEWIIAPKETKVVMTGLSVAIPNGYEMQVRPRSGMTVRTKLRVHLGTIDSDYRGEIGIIVENVGEDYIRISNGERIAQGVISPIERVVFIEADELDETKRGYGGFGSTGVKSELSDLIKQVLK